ncbi:MAG: hypothetical protein HRU19_20775 [Pseudobacteriovorax sp.]|nr:hypothetical protein [Pseudobacteriovorax sp.]
MSLFGSTLPQMNHEMSDLFATGRFDLLFAENGVFLYTRRNQDRLALVAINTGEDETSVRVDWDERCILSDLNGIEVIVPDADGGLEISMEAQSVGIFHNNCYEAC